MSVSFDILLTEDEIKQACIVWLKENRKISTTTSKNTNLKIIVFPKNKRLFEFKWKI